MEAAAAAVSVVVVVLSIMLVVVVVFDDATVCLLVMTVCSLLTWPNAIENDCFAVSVEGALEERRDSGSSDSGDSDFRFETEVAGTTRLSPSRFDVRRADCFELESRLSAEK